MVDNAPVIRLIPVDRILPSRHQARKVFDEDGLKGLAASIDKEGLLEPVMVRVVPAPNPLPAGASADGEWYELIYGERRLRAHKLLGRETIEARVTTVVSEAESAAKGLVENLQREDINPMDEAEGYAHLNQLDPGYWTHERIAEVIGRDRSYITHSIGMLQLPDSVKDNVRHRTLSRSHALDLLRLPSADLQSKAAEQIIAKDLNLANARTLISKMIENQANNSKTDESEQAVGAIPVQSGESAAQPPFFRISKSGQQMRIIASFPLTATLPELLKALKEAFGKWLKQQKNMKKGHVKGTTLTHSPMIGGSKGCSPTGMDVERGAEGGDDGGNVSKTMSPHLNPLPQGARKTEPNPVEADPKPCSNQSSTPDYDNIAETTIASSKTNIPTPAAGQSGTGALTQDQLAEMVAASLEDTIKTLNQRLAEPGIAHEEAIALKEALKNTQKQLDDIRKDLKPKPPTDPNKDQLGKTNKDQNKDTKN